MTLVVEQNQFTDFCPVDFGQEDCAPSHSYGPHVREFYLIHYVSSGWGVFINDRGTYHVKAGQAFLIRPGEVCKYTADQTNPWSYTWISFTGVMSASFDSLPDVFEADGLIFEEMAAVWQLSSSRAAYLSGMLFKLYCSLFDHQERPDYVNRVLGHLTIHYMQPLSIETIADQLGVSRKYLARIFKERTGGTMQQFLMQKRMSEAKKFLSRGFNVKETASMVGYTDSFVFSKAFKKHYGLSPKHYQKQ